MASEQKNRDRSRSRDRGHDRAHSNRSEPPSATSNRYDPRYPPPPPPPPSPYYQAPAHYPSSPYQAPLHHGHHPQFSPYQAPQFSPYQMHFDEARDEILEILTKNVRAFVIMAEYVKWMITPTTWRVLFTAPLVILLLLFVNKSKNKRLSLNDLSDEFSELCVQMIKVLCRSNSSRKEGALTSIMDRINFSLLAALHCGIWRPNGPSNQNEEMPWMAKPFEFNGYDDYAIKIVEALRGMASGTVDMNKNFFADEWNHVFATPRMLKLIELIKKYQDEGEFEEDAIVEAILNESRDGEDIEMIDKSEKSPNTNQKKSTKENKKKSNANAGAKQKRNTKPKNNKKSTNGTGAKKNNRREPRPAARRA
eukprot:28958_1